MNLVLSIVLALFNVFLLPLLFVLFYRDKKGGYNSLTNQQKGEVNDLYKSSINQVMTIYLVFTHLLKFLNLTVFDNHPAQKIVENFVIGYFIIGIVLLFLRRLLEKNA